MDEYDKNYPKERIRLMKIRLVSVVSKLCFFIILSIGILVFKDCGIPSDEPDQIYVAKLNRNYIFQHDPTVLIFRDCYYGVVFELPLLWLIAHFSIPRHLLLFLILFIGLIVFYTLAFR